MTTPLECPPLESWQALLRDDLSIEEQECFEQHLEACPLCQARMDQGEAEEPLLGLARRLGDPTHTPTDSTLSWLLTRLHGDSAESSDWGEPIDLSFLGATSKPGLLGTLGRYEIQEIIARGGMGTVLKALDPILHRVVAIKVLNRATSTNAQKRFFREARAAAALSHEHIVPLYSVSESNGVIYLAMEYVAGKSLQDHLDHAGALDVADVVRLGEQTAAGLAAAHARGLIHRDVTPANLLLENGLAKLKITDFGLAVSADDVRFTQAGVVVGTPGYMSPEQARGEVLDHRSDLFSLGSVLYAMCTGVAPFRGESALGVLRKVIDEEPVPIRVLKSDVPEWLEGLIGRLLAKNPDDRFQSAAEVATLLQGFSAHLHQPASVPPPALPAMPSPARPRTSISRKHIQLLAVAAFLPCLLVGLLTVLGLVGGGLHPQAAGSQPAEVRVRRLQGHTGPVHDLCFTPDGKRLVSGSGWPAGDKSVRVWDLGTGNELKRFPVPAQVHSLELSPDSRSALVGLGNGTILHLDLETGEPLKALRGHRGSVGWAGFTPDGKYAFSIAGDGTARQWDLANGKETRQFAVLGKRVRGGGLLPDGQRLLTSNVEGVLQLWDVATGNEAKRIAQIDPWFVDSLSIVPGGRQALVTGVGGVRLIDLQSGQEIRHFQEDQGEVHHAALSPDGIWLLTASFDGQVRLWDFASGQFIRVLGGQEGFGLAAAFSPDGRLAATGGGGQRVGDNYGPGTDHDIRLWDLGAVPREVLATPPARSRAWLMAATLVFLLLALSALGIGLFNWRKRRPRQQTPQPAAGAESAGATPAAPPISFRCAACGKDLKCRPDLAGRKVRCPRCGKPVPVPAIIAAGSDRTTR